MKFKGDRSNPNGLTAVSITSECQSSSDPGPILEDRVLGLIKQHGQDISPAMMARILGADEDDVCKATMSLAIKGLY